jgi:hypothetical protein
MGEIGMFGKSSMDAIRVVLMVAMIAVTFVPAVRGGGVDAGKFPSRASARGPAAIVIAQGRCFNGRCF